MSEVLGTELGGIKLLKIKSGLKLLTRKHVAIEIETYHNEEGLKSRIIKVAGIIQSIVRVIVRARV